MPELNKFAAVRMPEQARSDDGQRERDVALADKGGSGGDGGLAAQGSGWGVVVGPLTATVAGDEASFQTRRSTRSVRGCPAAERAW